MDYSEKYGNNIEEAVELALKDLKASREDVTVKVLEQPSRGFLGIGSKLAKVRVERKEKGGESDSGTGQQDDREQEHAGSEKEPIVQGASAGQSHDAKPVGRPEEPLYPETHHTPSIMDQRPDDLVEVQDHPAMDFLRGITEKMGLHLHFHAMQNEDHLFLDIDGKEVGAVIGKRGQTLDAIQYLTSLVVNKDRQSYMRVILDAEHYRAKREQTLEQLAHRLAGKVARNHRRVRLEPMNPYERMVIHATLQEDDRVSTRSEGEEPYRRVIIERKK